MSVEFPVQDFSLNVGSLTFSAFTCGWKENPDGPVVLCLHGFPDNARSFRFQWQPLAAAGFRVLSPTLRGYDTSSVPADDDFDMMTLGRDVIAWLDTIGVEKAHLVGHDWGAAVTYTAGALAPERFLSLTTIAVPHAARFAEGIKKVPRQMKLSWYMMFFQLRGIAEYLVERDDWALIRKLWKNWSPDFVLTSTEWDSLRATFAAPGVKKSMLAYYRQNASPSIFLGLRKPAVAELSIVPVRTLAITGAQDGCIDTALYDHVFLDEDFPEGIRVERIPGAGHFAHQEKPEEVTNLLLRWFAGE